MTGFSYVVSYWKKTQFKEPELLNVLISRSDIFPIKISKKSFFSWPLHYSVGIIIVIAFDYTWKNTGFSPSILSGAVLGMAAGIIGITGWKCFFWLHHDPPDIRFLQFLVQLFAAHILFGMVAGAVYAVW